MASRKAKIPPPILAGDSLIQLERGLALLKNLASQLQDDPGQQLWNDVKSCQRELAGLQTSFDERLGEIDKALQERCAVSADAADDLNGEIQTLGTKLQALAKDQATATTHSNDALYRERRGTWTL